MICSKKAVHEYCYQKQSNCYVKYIKDAINSSNIMIWNMIKYICYSGIDIIFGGEGLKHLDKLPRKLVKTFNSYNELHSIV